MEERLSDMVKSDNNDVEEITIENFDINKKGITETVPIMRNIKLISLSEWFMKYKTTLKEMGIGFLKLTIADVDPDESLLFTISHPTNKGESDQKKKLRFFDDANKILIPDLENQNIRDLGSGLFVSQKFDENTTILNYIKSVSYTHLTLPTN